MAGVFLLVLRPDERPQVFDHAADMMVARLHGA